MPTKKETTKAWAVMVYDFSGKKWDFLKMKNPDGTYAIAIDKGKAEVIKDMVGKLSGTAIKIKIIPVGIFQLL